MVTWIRQLSLLFAGVTFSSLLTTTVLAHEPRSDAMAAPDDTYRTPVPIRIYNEEFARQIGPSRKSADSQLGMSSDTTRGSKRNAQESWRTLCQNDNLCDCEHNEIREHGGCTSITKCPRQSPCGQVYTDATFCFMVTKSFPSLGQTDPMTAHYDYTVFYEDEHSNIHHLIDQQDMPYDSTLAIINANLRNVFEDRYPSLVSVTIRNHARSCPNP